jgi:copper chaperone NosL
VDAHKHLTVVGQDDPAGRASWHRGLRWTVVALAALAIAAYAASFFQVWWRFTLYAPQYPHGLRLAISLTGMGGDVREIDMLNHYIGMGHMADAAARERELAGWGVGLIAVLVLGTTLLAGKNLGRAILVPGVAFPAVFLADAFYWLHHFGHNLDPRAPLHIPPFTPELFGNGQIGQFMTFAVPGPGFWLATTALGLLLAAVVVRARVCRDCPLAGQCGAVCPRALVGPQPGEAA